MKGERLIDLLMSLSQKCSQKEEEIRRQLQLSPAEYRALHIIDPEEKTTCKQLSQRMNLSVSRGSRVVDMLYEKGCLNREDCLSDRRCKSVSLSKKGMMVQKNIHDRLSECDKRFLDQSPGKMLENVKQNLKDLIDKI